MQTRKAKTPSQHPRRHISRFLAAEMVCNSTCDGPVQSDCVPKNQEGKGRNEEGRGRRKERIVVAGRNVQSLPQIMCEGSSRGIQLAQGSRSVGPGASLKAKGPADSMSVKGHGKT